MLKDIVNLGKKLKKLKWGNLKMLELEIKKQCRVCGSKNVRDDVMPENGESVPILVCLEVYCGWWGS